MDPRDEPEYDFLTVAPYDSIVRRLEAHGSQEVGIELARETWLAIQEEKICAWDEARGRHRRESTEPRSPSQTPLSPPPQRRRNTD